MTRKHDPDLLTDDADDSPEVRALLAAGSTDDIDYDFDRGLRAHLGAIGGVPGPSAGASAKTAASGISSKALLLFIGGPLAAAAAVSVGVALSSGAFGGPHGPARTVASAASVAVTAPAATNAGAAAGEQAIAAREPSTVRPEESAPAADREWPGAVRGSLGADPRPAPHPALGPDPAANLKKSAHDPQKPSRERSESEPGKAPRVAESLAESASNSGASAPTVAAPAALAPSAAAAAAERAEEAALEAAAQRRKAKADEAARVADQRLEREMAALAEAKHALTSDPARAVSLAREGDRDFPHGVFGEERRHILILALIRLGRLDEARRLAAPYLEQHPDSPFARRVRTALDAAGSKR